MGRGAMLVGGLVALVAVAAYLVGASRDGEPTARQVVIAGSTPTDATGATSGVERLEHSRRSLPPETLSPAGRP